MKNILVVSDLHYEKVNIQKIMPKIAEADMIVFCGDGYDSFVEKTKAVAGKVFAVKGNCDTFSNVEDLILQVENLKILVTHGHKHGVKSGLFNLRDACLQAGASVAFFGHTHYATEVCDGGVKMINPGAISDTFEPTYYFCTVSGDKLFGKHVEV
ncbi:MAG: YfcE family phosphodiesterase [Bacillota bacterium]